MDFVPDNDQPNLFTYGKQRVRFAYVIGQDETIEQAQAWVYTASGEERRIAIVQGPWLLKQDAVTAIKALAREVIDRSA